MTLVKQGTSVVIANYNGNLVFEMNKEYSQENEKELSTGTIHLANGFELSQESLEMIEYSGDGRIPAGDYEVIRNPESSTFLMILK